MHEAFGERMLAPRGAQDGDRRRPPRPQAKKGFYTYDGKKKEVDETVYDLLPGGRERKRDRPRGDAPSASRCRWSTRRCAAWARASSGAPATATSAPSSASASRRSGAARSATSTRSARQTVLAKIEGWHQRFGKRFEPAPLLVEMAKENKKFYP